MDPLLKRWSRRRWTGWLRATLAIALWLGGWGLRPVQADIIDDRLREAAAPLEATGAATDATAAPAAYAPGQVIVKLKGATPPGRVKALQALARRHPRAQVDQLFKRVPDAASLQRRFPGRSRRAASARAPVQLDNIHTVTLEAKADVRQAVEELRLDPDVAYAEPNYLVHATQVPNDPYFSSAGSWGQAYDDLWGLKKIQAEPAWDFTMGQGIVVAVSDTGVDYTHPDLAANVWTNPGEIPDNGADDDGNGFVDDVRGWNFVRSGNDPRDDHGHGTHVSGTIAALCNNGIGIAGVAPQAQILPVKFLDSSGSGWVSDGAATILYAAQNGADVINMSWGGPLAQVIEDAVAWASQAGVVLVAAAGNNAGDVQGHAPAAYPEVIAVASTDHNDRRSTFSNWGAAIALSAPGGDSADPNDTTGTYTNILSLLAQGLLNWWDQDKFVGTGYWRLRGTSMAAPHVSGVAALILSRQPTLSNTLTRFVLEGSADDVNAVGFDRWTGYGRLNAAKAVAKADRALGLPEFVVAVSADKAVAAPNSPVRVTLTAQNIGLADDAAGMMVELFDGPPVKAALLRQWTLPSLAAGAQQELTLLSSFSTAGTHVLYAVVDRQQTVEELLELNNQATTPVAIASARFAERRITDHPAHQYDPALDGHRLVWLDYRNDIGDYNWDIYSYDLATGQERQVTTYVGFPNYQVQPDVSGDRVVWLDPRRDGWQVYSYDFMTGEERRITTDLGGGRQPAVSGDRVVWLDGRVIDDEYFAYNIYGYDFATGTEQRLTTDPNWKGRPAVAGDRVVWTDYRNGNFDIYGYDFATGEERPITTDPSWQSNAALAGDDVVWADARNRNLDIYRYDFATGTEAQVTLNPWNQLYPDVDQRHVVWMDDRNGNWDIYYTDLATGDEMPVTTEPHYQGFPVISGRYIGWEDNRNGQLDIYVAEGPDAFPAVPTGLTAAPARSVRAVALDWADNTEADMSSYTIYRSLSAGGPYEPIGTSAASNYSDANVTPKTLYFYRVTATDRAGGESGLSVEVSSLPGPGQRLVSSK